MDVPKLESVEDFATKISECGALLNMVEPENRHLTLKFLGDVDESSLGDIADVLRGVACGFAPMLIGVSGAGVFPDRHYVKVVWIGFRGSRPLIKLAHDIDNAMTGLGFEEEGREYRPHLTIARVKAVRDRDALLSIVDEYRDTQLGEMNVGAVKLMTSELTPDGPLYRVVCEIPLEKRAAVIEAV